MSYTIKSFIFALLVSLAASPSHSDSFWSDGGEYGYWKTTYNFFTKHESDTYSDENTGEKLPYYENNQVTGIGYVFNEWFTLGVAKGTNSYGEKDTYYLDLEARIEDVDVSMPFGLEMDIGADALAANNYEDYNATPLQIGNISLIPALFVRVGTDRVGIKYLPLGFFNVHTMHLEVSFFY